MCAARGLFAGSSSCTKHGVWAGLSLYKKGKLGDTGSIYNNSNLNYMVPGPISKEMTHV